MVSAVVSTQTDPTEDLYHWTWPYGSDVNGAEIDTFTGRLVRFGDQGRLRLMLNGWTPE